MRRTHNSISWIEILIINLAAILAIGAMGTSRQSAATGATSDISDRPVLIASR